MTTEAKVSKLLKKKGYTHTSVYLRMCISWMNFELGTYCKGYFLYCMSYIVMLSAFHDVKMVV